jgi:endonuclease YncB( thermonuclease family)
MDLRAYYQKIRETEALLNGEHFVVVSLATSEGGKAGVRTEVRRSIAAKLIAEGRARVASDEEGLEYYTAQREARERIEAEQSARRMQVMVIPHQDLNRAKERK